MSKLISPAGAAALVPDREWLACTGFICSQMPETLLRALEARFLAGRGPWGLKAISVTSLGDRRGAGWDRLAHEGLLAEIICSHYGFSPRLGRMITSGQVGGHCWPQGVISHWFRAVAGGGPGVISPVGLGTFVDPRQEGGRCSAKATGGFIELLPLSGRDWLWYKTWPIKTGFLRASEADEQGNLSFDHEPGLGEALVLAQAVRNSGGRVIAQVGRLVARLDPRRARVPGVLVDNLVLAEEPNDQRQTMNIRYDPALCGHREDSSPGPHLPLGPDKVVGRRAARELAPGQTANFGIGLPEAAALVALEEGLDQYFHFSLDTGVFGGQPLTGDDYGAARNPRAFIEGPALFDFYDGSGLDVAFLGLGELDARGHVNVSRFKGRLTGCGGFINIASGAKKVCFCGRFTANGFQGRVENGRLLIIREGRVKKMVAQVRQITFNGPLALEKKQQVLYITERAVFRLGTEGPVLEEIAPGLDLRRHILDQMDFRPLISPNLRLMPEELFQNGLMGLPEKWPAGPEPASSCGTNAVPAELSKRRRSFN